MTIKKESIETLLGFNKYNIDEEKAHIMLDEHKCAECKEKPCLRVCPAGLYKLDKNNVISFDYAGCLECGTCRIICHEKGQDGIKTWNYPQGTFGICFRYG